MTVEIPEFTRCCFCLPLRAGLLAWGYFKIIVNMLIIPILAYFTLSTIVMSLYSGGSKRYAIWILLYSALALGTLTLFITEFVAAIVFVIAGHQKNVNIIRGYFIYSIIVFFVALLLMVIGVGISMVNWDPSHMWLYLMSYAAYLFILAVQAYIILLLRSVVIKMKGSNEARYKNNVAEAQCMVTTKEKEAAVDNV